MKIIQLKRDYLINELDLPYNAIEDNIIDTGRWNIQYEIIFEHDNKFYKTYYSEGKTEMQDESPWEYEEYVECVEVEKKEVVVKKWIPVE